MTTTSTLEERQQTLARVKQLLADHDRKTAGTASADLLAAHDKERQHLELLVRCSTLLVDIAIDRLEGRLG